MPSRSSADLLDRAKQADIREVASRYTTLKRVTAIDGAGPCPVCGGRDRFGVNVRKQVWNCRGCGKGGDVIALVQHVERLPFQAAVERLTGEQIERERTRLPEAPKRQLEPDDKRIHDFSRKIAARIVSEIVPLIGTPGETYLRDVRKIDATPIADVLSSTYAIGWHPSVLFREDGHDLDGQRIGAIIGILIDPISAEPTGAISRTYLHEGRKVGKAKSLAGSGVVQLSPDDEVLQGIHIAEGLETALDMMARGFRPMWSCGSTAMMATFPVLNAIESITIFADNDENDAGKKAASEVDQRWRGAGREALVLVSPVPGDFNDVSMRGSP
jgi:hypothetical protein